MELETETELLADSRKDGELEQKKQKLNVDSTSSPSSDIILPQLEETNESRERAFKNDLIWRKLGQCLSHHDLKQVRLVSKRFNNFVLNQANFNHRTLVNLHPKGRLSHHDFGSSTVLWKHFKLPYFYFFLKDTDKSSQHHNQEENENNNKNKLNWFYPLLKYAQSIAISVEKKYWDFIPLDQILAAPGPKTLRKLALQSNLLLQPTVLKSLLNLSDSDSSHFNSARNNLQTVWEFHISAAFSVSFRAFERDVDKTAFKILDLLQTHLKQLRVIRVEPIFNDYLQLEVDKAQELAKLMREGKVSGIHKRLVNLIKVNQNRLLGLHLVDMQMWMKYLETETGAEMAVESVFDMKFPALKSLSMKTCRQDEPILNFLNNQPPLEELDISILNTFPLKVLGKIRETHGKSLKKMNMQTKGFDEKRERMWNFLEDLTRLEHFEMTFILPSNCRQNGGSVKSVLKKLPPSVRKQSLKNFLPDSRVFNLESESEDEAI